jgi:DNA-binding IclR family transcriptional regulator
MSRCQLFREILAPRMDALCQSVECTVEWYEPVAEGMKLVLQKHPATELYVHAKPGFIRDWTTEFEAVTRLAHAFSAEAPALTRIETYATNGRMETLDKTTIKNLIKAAREDPIAYDRAYNSRGVRRFAAAGFDHDTGEWLGVLAIAEGYHFFRKTQPQAYLKSLKATLNPN